MNEHLQLVRQLHEAMSYPQAGQGANRRPSDMDVIKHQALLMEAGSTALYAIKVTEIVDILTGLVSLAYIASAAIAVQGGDITEKPVSWRQDGSVLTVMKIISDKINQCAEGNCDNYSELYHLCLHLVRGFINADFDKAFRLVHNSHISRFKEGGESIYGAADNHYQLKMKYSPDLSECLFE
ncbi:MAG: hypothetical protein PHR16_05125 [Methylovulum sp.]|nr:hypothetical protein [Methylovulum sp.]